jgi:hypothetical protein
LRKEEIDPRASRNPRPTLIQQARSSVNVFAPVGDLKPLVQNLEDALSPVFIPNRVREPSLHL